MGFLETSEWREHCEKWGGGWHSPHFWKFYRAATAPDVAHLVGRIRSSVSPRESGACLELLYRLLKDRDERLSVPSRLELVEFIDQRIRGGFVPAHYSREQQLQECWAMAYGERAVEVFQEDAKREGRFDAWLFSGLVLGPNNLRGGEKDASAYRIVFPDVVLGCSFSPALEIELCPQGVQLALVGHLQALGTDRAKEALRRLEGVKLTSELARNALDLLGVHPPDRIDALSEEWRRSGSGDTLQDLYNKYLDRLPIGTPMGPWLVRLGPPATQFAGCVTYSSISDPHYALYIELDADGGLRGISLKRY